MVLAKWRRGEDKRGLEWILPTNHLIIVYRTDKRITAPFLCFYFTILLFAPVDCSSESTMWTDFHLSTHMLQIHANTRQKMPTVQHLHSLGIVFFVDNLMTLYSFPSLPSHGYLTYICSTTLHLNLPSPPIYPTLHFYTIYLLPILYLLHPSTTIGTPIYISTPFLFYFPLLKWYCFRIGFTKTSNGSISLSGNKPNSVQKNIKCLKHVFKCGAICNASNVPKKLLYIIPYTRNNLRNI